MAVVTPTVHGIRFERGDAGRWVLHARQTIPLPRERVFPFFADATNLARITPPSMGFAIVSPTPIAMREGALIDYRIRVAGVRLRWRTRISRWDPPREFVDEQLRGPYAEWHHLHRFTAVGDRETRMDDEVTWRLPLGLLGRPAGPIVRRQLRAIFSYRRRVIEELVRTGAW